MSNEKRQKNGAWENRIYNRVRQNVTSAEKEHTTKSPLSREDFETDTVVWTNGLVEKPREPSLQGAKTLVS